jgi:hypothetical protein
MENAIAEDNWIFELAQITYGYYKLNKNMRCDQNKNNFIYLINSPVINEKLLK